jgi:hypothetical protein
MVTRETKHSDYCDIIYKLPCNCNGNVRFDPAIVHGKCKGGCYCDYSSGLMEDSCGCCGAKSGEPCVISEPSQAVDSSTKSDSIVESLEEVKNQVEILKYELNQLKTKMSIYDGYTRKMLICSQHIPCCELRGIKRKYDVCYGSTPSRVTTCNCHKGRP